MRPFCSTQSGIGGHPRGGPRCFAACAALIAAATLAGCAGASGPERPRPSRGEAFSRPLEIYRDLGFLTGSGQFPVVASFSTIAGPTDSTFVLIGMSMPNSALRFQRGDGGFYAEYSIDIAFMDTDSVQVRRFSASETVRIPSFSETGRTDESVVFQHAIAVPPGRYIVRVQANDQNSSRGFRMTDTLTAPSYGEGRQRLASPLLVYQADGRETRSELPKLIVNPRHTVPYGGEAPLLYLESYGDEQPIDVEVLNEGGAVVWSARATLNEGEDALRYGVVPIPSETFPLGRFWVQIARGDGPRARTPLVLTISDQWMVANFEEVLQFLRYIAYPEEVDSLRLGTPTERRERWEAFWDRRNPLPMTGVNEYRDQFFQRVRYATEAFRESGGRAGWATDRGEVYIVLGPPDHAVERFVGRQDISGRPNAEEWIYNAVPGGRLNLLFHDRTGFGRYELVPSSAAAFRSTAERLKPRLSRE
jgi:GWxTD domain-containing protein